MSHSNLTLVEVTEMHALIKGVVSSSRKVYLVSMNAMLFSRNVAGDNSGFVMVTSQLRDFSTKLNYMMSSLVDMMSKIVNEVALYVKLSRNFNLIHQALETTSKAITFKTIQKFNQQRKKIERARLAVSYETRQLRLMTKMGANLVVLARVESEGKDNSSGTLNSIISEMDQAMEVIEESVNAVQKIVL